MFNSPLHFCPVCKQHVALDQSKRECATEHGCEAQCPLAHVFSGQDPAAAPGIAGDVLAAMAQSGTPTSKR